MMTVLLRSLGLLGVLAAALALSVWFNFDWVRFNTVVWLSAPSQAFDDLPPPPAFDYASDAGWAALPTLKDNADEVVEGAADQQANAAVDVFFVHGTTFSGIGKGSWNQRADDKETNAFTDLAMRAASVFNACCKVYAPRYRQFGFGAAADLVGSGQKAMDLAYGDVERAFDEFIAHRSNGRPFILAGASQGSRHVFDLIKRRIAGQPLAGRMVAAYPLIWWMTKEQFAKDAPGIPVCGNSSDTGCVITFNPIGPHVRTGLLPIFDRTGLICVNPLTWRADTQHADFALNLGTRRFKDPAKLVPGMADARCDETGHLLVSEIRVDMYEGLPFVRSLFMNVFGRDNYHSIALGLFYGNIRQNAQERVKAFLAKKVAH